MTQESIHFISNLFFKFQMVISQWLNPTAKNIYSLKHDLLQEKRCIKELTTLRRKKRQHNTAQKASHQECPSNKLQNSHSSNPTVIRTEHETKCIFTLKEQRKPNTVTTQYA